MIAPLLRPPKKSNFHTSLKICVQALPNFFRVFLYNVYYSSALPYMECPCTDTLPLCFQNEYVPKPPKSCRSTEHATGADIERAISHLSSRLNSDLDTFIESMLKVERYLGDKVFFDTEEEKHLCTETS